MAMTKYAVATHFVSESADHYIKSSVVWAANAAEAVEIASKIVLADLDEEADWVSLKGSDTTIIKVLGE